MTWFARPMVVMLLTTMFALFATGCTIDQHIEKTIKIDDPFASESEQQFVGLILNYWKLPDGESTLFTFPNGKNMLIDTGSETDAETLLSYLSEHKITKLDYVVLTNDLDNHVGGYKYLEKNVQIQTILMPKPIASSIRQAVPIATDKSILLLTEGQSLPIDQNVSLFVLHPSEHTLLSPQDNSLVFQLKHDQLRFLFTGGVGEAAEAQLLRRHKQDLPAEVLKVAEQGSNQGSSQLFLTAVDPQVAIIQTGRSRIDMKQGQEEIIERLAESWAETYITSQHGTITVLSNGKDYRVLKGKKR